VSASGSALSVHLPFVEQFIATYEALFVKDPSEFKTYVEFSASARRVYSRWKREIPLLGRQGDLDYLVLEYLEGETANGADDNGNGLIDELDLLHLRGDRHFYESHGPRDHIHVACLRCGKVREVESELYEELKQQIARDLTITYVSNVSSTQQQVIQVEYNVNRNVSIVALRDYNGTFGIDVKIKKRFD